MRWTPAARERLYELYVAHDTRLRAEVIDANRSLGSAHPDRTQFKLLTQLEFERQLASDHPDPQAKVLWLKRIVEGFENEFPELETAGPSLSRATGT
ncbi:MAG: hypothetical protein AB7O59_05180 [Pirellulales bacterium]